MLATQLNIDFNKTDEILPSWYFHNIEKQYQCYLADQRLIIFKVLVVIWCMNLKKTSPCHNIKRDRIVMQEVDKKIHLFLLGSANRVITIFVLSMCLDLLN